MRIVYVRRLFYTSYDVTWIGYQIWLWTSIETSLGIVCASGPALKIFFRRYFNVSTIGSGLKKTFAGGKYYKENGMYYNDQTGTAMSAPERRNNSQNGSTNSHGDHSQFGTTCEVGGKFSTVDTRPMAEDNDTDVELGTIKVMREIDIGEEDMRTPSELSWSRRGSQDQLKSAQSYGSLSRNHGFDRRWSGEGGEPLESIFKRIGGSMGR